MNIPEIRARCEAATEGPWETRPIDDCDPPGYRYNVYSVDNGGGWQICSLAGGTDSHELADDIEEQANADFIAAAKQDIPALCDHIDKLQSELSDAHKALRDE